MTDGSSGSQYGHSAEWYDRIYANMRKDYAAEAAVVDGIIRARAPGASSLLDVGCGTGLHLQQFAELYDATLGVDLDPQFVARARARGCQATVGDMRTFQLDRSFDAVTCLFSAIGHVGEEQGLDAAVERMAAHLEPGGVVVIEPWILPEQWRDGSYGVEVAETSDSTLIRASHSSSEGNVSVLRFAWTEVSRAGVQRLDDEMRLTRFSLDEYRAAFERAQLSLHFDSQGCSATGRGLLIGTKAGAG